jgi:assimilatory nitrate reductase catalytic subunit
MSGKPPAGIAARIASFIHAKTGPLTDQLERAPGRFGLGQTPTRLAPDKTTTMVCGFCSTGCGLNVHLKDGVAINASPAPDYPVNLGKACPKGWEALSVLASDDRATTPLLRGEDGVQKPVAWTDALNAFVTRFRAIQDKHGPESVAFLGTGQLPTEELAFLGALSKFGMGMIHGDGNTRQCMATSVVAYKESFGFDAPPYTYADFEQSDVLVFVGANPCIAHPILWQRVCRNKNNPEIIVLDPRRTETAEAATLHVPLKPKSDLTLLYSVAHVLIRENWIDRAFIDKSTEGFDGFAEHVRAFSPAAVSAETGLPPEMIERLAQLIHNGKRVSFWWTMGVNQSHQAVRTAQAIINLALMTGNIGRPGTGPNSITGQCNAMGSRLFSNTTNLLGGHQFDNPAHRDKVARALGIDAAKIPDRGSQAYDQIMDGILRGKIKGLWIVATNTAHSWISQKDARHILEKLDFLVVQDMYSTTHTAKMAHLLLPAAGWGEKEGTFINSERRIGLVKQVMRAPGQALSDFRIFQLIADAWGVGDMFSRFDTPENTFKVLQQCSRDQPCDISGIDGYADLEQAGGRQWPVPMGAENPATERRLFEDGKFFTKSGLARFVFEASTPMPELVSTRFPLMLLTGRGSSSQWHTETRTAKSAVLQKLAPRVPYVEIDPDDALALGVGPTDWVRVTSQRGSIEARAHITRVVARGQCFMPMHFPDTNVLTLASFDPYSRQPAYKGCAVKIEKLTERNAVLG